MRPTTKTAHDLRKAFVALRAFMPVDGDGGGDEDKDDKDGDGSSGTGADDDGDDKEASGTDSSKDIKDPEKKKLSDEAKQRRLEAKAEKARADKAEAELRKLTDKDKTELDLAKRDNEELKSENAVLRTELVEARRRLAFYDSGASSLFAEPEDALKLLDLSDLEPDEDGKYDLKAFKKRAEDFVKAKPRYARDDSSSADDDQPSSGRPLNGQRKTKQDLDKQALVRKFPALQGR